jgi:hypothetical protein
MRRLAPLVALLLAMGIAPLRAQSGARGTETSELQPGARLRIQAPGIVAGRHVATLLSRSADTITIGGPGTVPIAIPIARVSSMEISKGKSRSLGAVRGVEWGAPIGAGFGLLTLGAIHDCRNCNPQEQPTDGGWVAFSAVAGALWGAAIGAIVGRERWESFDLSHRAALGVRPSNVVFSIRLDF